MADKCRGVEFYRKTPARDRYGFVRVRDSSVVIPCEGRGFDVPEDGPLLLQDNERGRRIVSVIRQTVAKDQFEVEEAGMRAGAFRATRQRRVTCTM